MQYASFFLADLFSKSCWQNSNSQLKLCAPIVKLTLTFAQLTEDCLNSLIGLSARLHAEEDLKVEAEFVPTLLQHLEGLVAMETIRNLETATLALALGDHKTSDVVRISHSQMAPLVSVTLTTQMELFAVLSGDGATPNQNRVLVVPASTTAEVSLNMKGSK